MEIPEGAWSGEISEFQAARVERELGNSGTQLVEHLGEELL